MPRIPTYEAHIGLPDMQAPRMNPAAAGAEFAAMGQFGQAVGDAVLKITQQIQEGKGTEQYVRSVTESRKAMSDLYEQTVNSPEFVSDPEAATAKYNEGIESIRSHYQEQQWWDQTQRAKFQLDFENHANTNRIQIGREARRNRVASAIGGLDEAETEAINEASKAETGSVRDIMIRDQYEAAIDSYVQQGIIRADQAPGMKTKFNTAINEAQFDRDLRELGPEAARSNLDAGKYRGIDETRCGRMMDKAEARKDRLAAQAEADQRKYEVEVNRTVRFIGGKLDDSVATIAEMGEKGPVDYEAKLRSLGTEQALDLAEKYAMEKRLAMDTFKVTKGMEHLPLMEQADQVKRMFTVAPGEPGAKERIRAGEMAERVVGDRVKRFADDPATYVQPMGQALQLPGVTQEEQAGISFGLQNEIAKGVAGFSPKLFPEDAGKKLKDQWDAMTPDDRLNFTESLNSYGRFKGQAIAELRLGAGAQFAAVAHNADFKNRMLARALISAVDMKESDIPDNPNTNQTIKNDMQAALESNDVMRAMMGVSRYQPANGAHLSFMSDLQKGLYSSVLLHHGHDRSFVVGVL